MPQASHFPKDIPMYVWTDIMYISVIPKKCGEGAFDKEGRVSKPCKAFIKDGRYLLKKIRVPSLLA